MQLVLRFLDRKQEAVHRKHWGECSFATPSQSAGVREEKKENNLINSYDCQAITVSSNVKCTKKRDACAKWLFLLLFSWHCRHRCFLTTTTSKNNWFYEQNQGLLRDCDVKPLNATFCGGRGRTTKKVAYIWRIERFQIDAIKFERRQIHLSGDVFTAVVVVVCLSSLFTLAEQRIRKDFKFILSTTLLPSKRLSKDKS